MNNSAENFTSPEVHPSTNFTTNDFSPFVGLRIGVLCFHLLSGVPIYAYVLWLIATRRNGVASEFFNFNLNVCEIFFSLTSLAFLLSERFPGLMTLQRFLLGLAITVRPLFQCLICSERFMAVLHPVDFLKFKPFRYKIVCSVVVWLMGLGSCLFCMFSLLSFNMYAFTWFILIQFLPFLFIQLFCCLAVLRALKQLGPGERGRVGGEENHMKRKAFYLILIITVTMVIMFTPFIVMGFLYILQHDISVVLPISFICFILAGFVQPILYLHRAGKLSCFCSS
ncbi:C-C chemokine receptor 1-like protein 1 [Myxocyprinus asiaticus]|uniref:C-C chemokine receptor 1-like protein 1 n=1 Tax=Myxocyprinus asiaticus TaxID=70543 RepID=UPI002223E936|nr:C-C chemokine receptor 1-like protein 1 [Myxocyprinus asiaticus]